MRKYLTIINIVVLIINIFLIFYLMNMHQENYSKLQLYDWSGEHVPIRPLVTEYTNRNSEQTKTLASKREITNYLNNEDNVIHMYSVGTIRLDFWELGVVSVTARIDEVVVPVRRTDGQYFIDFEPKNKPMAFEITSLSESGTTKYIFKILMQETGELSRIIQCKEVISNTLNINGDQLYLCGYEKFYPDLSSEGYVIKTKQPESLNDYNVYGIDVTTHELYWRNHEGHYFLIENQ